MALLQNEDFAIWYLRTSYLANIKDGVGERLINVNSSILNTPAFRAAGWSVNAADVKRTYSPPIPTAFNSDYFQGPPVAGVQRVTSFGDEEEEGGMVTGRTGNDTVGPGPAAKRRRRKEHVDDDSSDLSDESDEDVDGPQRAAQGIRFAKMPVRHRADSSPIRNSSSREGPDVVVSSPSSRRSGEVGRARGASLGAVEAVKARARRDTMTSSELSSENELDPSYFQRRQVNPRNNSKSGILGDRAKEDNVRHFKTRDGDPSREDSDAESVGSGLSSELGATVDSSSLLNTLEDPILRGAGSSPLLSGLKSSISKSSLSRTSTNQSPKRTRTAAALTPLPPPRPISTAQPKSLLGAALRALKAKPINPIQPFASLSGKGSANPFWIKIYTPFSEDPETPIEVPLERVSKDGNNVIVAEAIGLSLWRYVEENTQPPLQESQLNVNKWVLRMVEEGEVEYDFPALGRTRPMSDFALNNLRGARGRSRERPYDEFALVEADAQEAAANDKATPQFAPENTAGNETPRAQFPEADASNDVSPVPKEVIPAARAVPVLGGGPFASALHNAALKPADQPFAQTSYATPRLGAVKTIRVRYFDLDVTAQSTTMEIASDSYIAEILDHVCKRWKLDKAGFLLKVTGTNTIAPLDRTLEALGTRSDLDLVRRRFGAGPLSLTGSPGSSSPNAPLLLDIEGPKKGKKGVQMLHPLAQKQDIISSASNFKKYNVTRKQLTSFAQANQRVLAFDGDFLHIMPADTGRTLFDSGAKVSSIAFNDILRCKVSSKHHKLVRVVVRRPTESKRYDFEAKSTAEAHEIVEEISKEMKLSGT